MSEPCLIVCERKGAWAAALRRELAGTTVRVHETRSLLEGRQALSEAPASVLVLELAEGREAETLDLLAVLGAEFPRSRAMVVAERMLSAYEWLARELGAVAFAVSPRRVAPLAGVVRRRLASVPPPEVGLTEGIANELPWS